MALLVLSADGAWISLGRLQNCAIDRDVLRFRAQVSEGWPSVEAESPLDKVVKMPSRCRRVVIRSVAELMTEVAPGYEG